MDTGCTVACSRPAETELSAGPFEVTESFACVRHCLEGSVACCRNTNHEALMFVGDEAEEVIFQDRTTEQRSPSCSFEPSACRRLNGLLLAEGFIAIE